MTEDVRERMFDPFFTTKGVKGLGLGMSIVYTAVQQNSGHIEVTSKPDQGTTVLMSFPIDREIISEEEPEPVLFEGTASVLLVDDNAEMVKVISRLLERSGHKVTSHTNPGDAIAAYRKERHDIVITDIGMSAMTGWELAQKIKEIDPEAAIVFITGWGAQVDHEKARRVGAKGIINKPLSKDKILGTINSILKDKR